MRITITKRDHDEPIPTIGDNGAAKNQNDDQWTNAHETTAMIDQGDQL